MTDFPVPPTFKGGNGHWLTKALFKDILPETGTWTIAQFREMFLSCSDPTEYEFANRYLGGYPHWKTLQKAPFLSPYLPAWREELDVKIRSIGLQKIIATAQGTGKDAYQAQKYLADRMYDRPTKGRPSKQQVANKAREIALEDMQIGDDYARIFN